MSTDIKTIYLTDPAPRARGPNPWGGWVDGEAVDILYDPESGTYGYCFWGVTGGLVGEADDVTGFASIEEAEEAAMWAAREADEEAERQAEIMRIDYF